MKLRSSLAVVCTAVLAGVGAGAAGAATGPRLFQLRAEEQTRLLFAQLRSPTQVASPATCDAGQRPWGTDGVFILPTLDSSAPGDLAFTCHVAVRRVLLDLGGGIATEDARGDTYTTADGQVLLFTRQNLEAICDDVLRFFPTPAPATLDSVAIGGTQVSTRAFEVPIHPTAPGTFWQDSIAVGHPGRLAASYCGWKTVLTLSPGEHVIAVDLSGVASGPTHFTYDIDVSRHAS
jgi:hypothetical protein